MEIDAKDIRWMKALYIYADKCREHGNTTDAEWATERLNTIGLAMGIEAPDCGIMRWWDTVEEANA